MPRFVINTPPISTCDMMILYSAALLFAASLASAKSSVAKWWKPAVGATWQIELSKGELVASLHDRDVRMLTYAQVSNTTWDRHIYDFDMFDNPASTIKTMHAMNRRVICYFSAGSVPTNNSITNNDHFLTSLTDPGKDGDPTPARSKSPT